MQLDRKLTPQQMEVILNEYHIEEIKRKKKERVKSFSNGLLAIIKCVLFFGVMLVILPYLSTLLPANRELQWVFYCITAMVFFWTVNRKWKFRRERPINTVEDLEKELRRVVKNRDI